MPLGLRCYVIGAVAALFAFLTLVKILATMKPDDRLGTKFLLMALALFLSGEIVWLPYQWGWLN